MSSRGNKSPSAVVVSVPGQDSPTQALSKLRSAERAERVEDKQADVSGDADRLAKLSSLCEKFDAVSLEARNKGYGWVLGEEVDEEKLSQYPKARVFRAFFQKLSHNIEAIQHNINAVAKADESPSAGSLDASPQQERPKLLL